MTSRKYKAFISYKHNLYSRAFAESIEHALKSYAKPLLQRPMPIFRDEKNVMPGENLPAAIRTGLHESDYIIYLASKEAAQAPWIKDEIKIWFDELKRSDRLIIAVIEDTIHFTGLGTEQQVDWDKTVILPEELRDRLPKNTLFVDFSWAQKETERTNDNAIFRQEINALSAALNGIEPGEMTDKAVIQYRKNRRLRTAAISALTTMFVVAIILGAFSFLQWQTAIKDRSSSLAFLSQRILSENPTLAYRIAEESRKLSLDNINAATALRSAYYAGVFYRTLTGHSGVLNDLAFSPIDTIIASCADDNAVIIQGISGHIIKKLQDHPGLVMHVAFSPDGKMIASGDNTGVIFLYTSQGERIARFAHRDLIESLQFSYDSKFLVSASRDSTARLWNVVTKDFVVFRHADRVYAACFSPDGTQVITTAENLAHRWNLSGKPLAPLKGHSSLVINAVFSHHGSLIATTGFDNTTIIWNNKGTLMHRFDKSRNVAPVVVFSPDDTRLAFAGWDRRVTLYNFYDSTSVSLEKHTDEILSCVFSPDGKYFASAGKDATIQVYTPAGKFIAALKGHTQTINKISFSPNSQYLISGGDEGDLFLWDLQNIQKDQWIQKGQLNFLTASEDRKRFLGGDHRGNVIIWDEKGHTIFHKKLHDRLVYIGSFSPDGNYIATASMDGSAALMHTGDTTRVYRLPHDNDVIDVSFSPDNSQLVTAGYDAIAKVWDMHGQLVFHLDKHTDRLYGARFSPDAKHIVTISRDRYAIIWDRQGKMVKRLLHAGHVSTINFNTTGDRFVTTCRNRTLTVWSTKGDSLFSHFCPPGYIVYQSKFSPDDNLIAASTSANNILIWNQQKELVADLKGHSNMVSNFIFTNDRKHFITTSMDQTSRLWTLSGDLRQVFIGHTSTVKSACLNADETSLLTVSYDHTLRIWPLQPNAIIKRVNELYPDGFYQIPENERQRIGIP